MLPERIRIFASHLADRTNQDEFVWSYDDVNATVRMECPEFRMTLRYSFNDGYQGGEFVLIYVDAADKEYRFYTNEAQPDYDVARRLYEVAQSSGMRLPF